MNQAYKPMYQKADHLHHELHDMLDDRDHPSAVAIRDLSRDVREEIEKDRSPRNVEGRIQQLQRQLERLKAAPNPAISPQDAASLWREYEELRRELRSLPDY